MNSIDFCYWLQGYFELQEGDEPLTAKQIEVLKNHLALVFKHEIDPLRESQTPVPPGILSSIHNGNDPLLRC